MKRHPLSNTITRCAAACFVATLSLAACDDAPSTPPDSSLNVPDAPIDSADAAPADVLLDVFAEVLHDAPVSDIAVSDDGAATAEVSPEVAVDVAQELPQEVAADVPDVSPAMLNGEPPSVAKALPSFVEVVDSTGAAVGPTDLTGHWTVLWFYPAATTSG